jgi:hypothetical protein
MKTVCLFVVSITLLNAVHGSEKTIQSDPKLDDGLTFVKESGPYSAPIKTSILTESIRADEELRKTKKAEGPLVLEELEKSRFDGSLEAGNDVHDPPEKHTTEKTQNEGKIPREKTKHVKIVVEEHQSTEPKKTEGKSLLSRTFSGLFNFIVPRSSHAHHDGHHSGQEKANAQSLNTSQSNMAEPDVKKVGVDGAQIDEIQSPRLTSTAAADQNAEKKKKSAHTFSLRKKSTGEKASDLKTEEAPTSSGQGKKRRDSHEKDATLSKEEDVKKNENTPATSEVESVGKKPEENNGHSGDGHEQGAQEDQANEAQNDELKTVRNHPYHISHNIPGKRKPSNGML